MNFPEHIFVLVKNSAPYVRIISKYVKIERRNTSDQQVAHTQIEDAQISKYKKGEFTIESKFVQSIMKARNSESFRSQNLKYPSSHCFTRRISSSLQASTHPEIKVSPVLSALGALIWD